MIALFIVLSFAVTTLLLRRNSSQKKNNSVIKVSERAWIINNKLIDLDAQEKREEEVRKMNKAMFDFEVGVAEREFQLREQQAKLTGSINMIGRRKVFMFNGKIL